MFAKTKKQKTVVKTDNSRVLCNSPRSSMSVPEINVPDIFRSLIRFKVVHPSCLAQT